MIHLFISLPDVNMVPVQPNMKQSSEWVIKFNGLSRTTKQSKRIQYIAVLSLEISVAGDFDKVAGTPIYFLQYWYMYFF